MKFPYQRSVGNDLRELFKYERLRAGADTLGQSSIDEGSGALEVRDGAGTAVAIGDLPGGGVGIGIRWQGNLTDLAQVLQDLADEIASGGGGGNNDAWDARQDRDIAGLRVRAGHIENKDTLQQQGIGKLGARADTKDREIAELRARVKALEARTVEQAGGIAKVGRATAQTARGLAVAKEQIRKNIGDLSTVTHKGDVLEVMYEEAQRNRTEDKGWIDRILEWLPDVELDIDNVWVLSMDMQSEVQAARGGRTSLSGRLSDMTNATSQAQATASSASSAATQANDRITDARGSYGSLTQRLNSMDSATRGAQSSADQANDRISSARGSYGSLTLRLNAADTATSNAQSTANSVQSEVTTARAGSSSLNARITAHRAALQTVVNKVDDILDRLHDIDNKGIGQGTWPPVIPG